MKYRYLVHTGFGGEEFEIMADGYDVNVSSGVELSVVFWAGVLIDNSLPGRSSLLHQAIGRGYWIQTLNFGERIERKSNAR